MFENMRCLSVDNFYPSLNLAVEFNEKEHKELEFQQEKIRLIKMWFNVDTIIVKETQENEFFDKLDKILWQRKMIMNKNYDDYKLKKLIEHFDDVDPEFIKMQYEWLKIGDNHTIAVEDVLVNVGYKPDELEEANEEIKKKVSVRKYQDKKGIFYLNADGIKEWGMKTKNIKISQEFIEYFIEIEKFANKLSDEICNMLNQQIIDTSYLVSNYEICKKHFSFTNDKFLEAKIKTLEDKVRALENKAVFRDGDVIIKEIPNIKYNSTIKEKTSKKDIMLNLKNLNKTDKECKELYKQLIEKLDLPSRVRTVEKIEIVDVDSDLEVSDSSDMDEV
jgi:hypothetical protein